MSEPYLGEIRMFAGNFAPRNNAQCNGQLMSIAQNAALFSLLGTFYGGNGTTTFGLPDFRGRVGINQGQGGGLSNYTIGQQGGTESVTLLTTQIPLHTHAVFGTSSPAASSGPVNNKGIPAKLAAPFTGFWIQDANKTGSAIPMVATELTSAGSNQAHENRMPTLTVTMIIALQGIFPSRN